MHQHTNIYAVWCCIAFARLQKLLRPQEQAQIQTQAQAHAQLQTYLPTHTHTHTHTHHNKMKQHDTHQNKTQTSHKYMQACTPIGHGRSHTGTSMQRHTAYLLRFGRILKHQVIALPQRTTCPRTNESSPPPLSILCIFPLPVMS